MTLWVGHLSKLVAEDDLSDAFGEQGQVNTIDLIPPRGCAFVCMNRRQDAYRVLNKLHKHKIHGKPITVRRNVDVQIKMIIVLYSCRFFFDPDPNKICVKIIDFMQ